MISAPSIPRFYYGWVIVAVCGLVNLATGILPPSLGILLLPMQRELGWSQATIILATTISTLLGAVVRPILGPYIDRYGGRVLMSAGAIVGGVAIMLSGQSVEPWHFYLFYGVLGVTVVQNVGSQTTGVIVAKWFVTMRGRALGFAATGISMGSFVGVVIVTTTLELVGWRLCLAILGMVIIFVIGVPSVLFMRRDPESMGLLPDGGGPVASNSPNVGAETQPTPQVEEQSWTPRQVLRSRDFWFILLAMVFATFPTSGYFIHTIPYLQGQQGFGTEANVAWSIWFIFSTISKVVWGFITEWFPARISCAISYIGEGVAMVILLFIGRSVPLLFLWAFVGGFFHGPGPQLQNLIFADYYGRRYLGTIRGFSSMPIVFTSAGGPLVAAFLFQSTGSYWAVWALFAATFFLGGLLVLLAGAPKNRAPAPVASEGASG